MKTVIGSSLIRSCFVAAAFALALAGCGGGGSGGGATGGGTVTLTGISITPSAPIVTQGLSVNLTATGTYSNGTTSNITGSVIWSSSNTAVATITASGTASSLAVGTSNISATLSGITSPVQALTVTAPVLTAIAIAPATASVLVGGTRQFTATGTYNNGTTADVTATAAWTSSNPAAATISTAGLASGQSVGSSNITASSGALTSNTATLTAARLMGGVLQGVPLNLAATVSTLAGSGAFGAADGIGTAASFSIPNGNGITTDGTNLYVADYSNYKIRRIVIATGAVTTLAGSGAAGSADGIGTSASFFFPMGITSDGTNLYVTDLSNRLIRKIVIASGAVTTLAGSGALSSVDGTGTAASFYGPYGITTDGANLYVLESNGYIRQIVIATGVVTTLAGSGVMGAADGIGTAASFSIPFGITTDGTNLYVADSSNNKIRKVVIATKVVTTLAGSGAAGATDGIGAAASFSAPRGITTDGTNLYVLDTGSHKIRKVVIATGAVTTLAGSGAAGAVDGTGVATSFSYPQGATSDGTNLYVMDNGNNKIRRVQ